MQSVYTQVLHIFRLLLILYVAHHVYLLEEGKDEVAGDEVASDENERILAEGGVAGGLGKPDLALELKRAHASERLPILM